MISREEREKLRALATAIVERKERDKMFDPTADYANAKLFSVYYYADERSMHHAITPAALLALLDALDAAEAEVREGCIGCQWGARSGVPCGRHGREP